MSTEAKEVLGQQAVANTQRVITIVTTRGEKRKIPFEGTEWSQLKTLLERGGTDAEGNSFSGYSLSNMKCVESINRSTLEHPKAVVPDGNFNLFLMPYKSKSGSGQSRPELYSTIKGIITKDGDTAKNHFNAGKHYTNKSTAELAELVQSYGSATDAEKKAEEDRKAAEAKKREEDEERERKRKQKERERKRKQKEEEDKKLDAELNDMMSGFDDVRRESYS